MAKKIITTLEQYNRKYRNLRYKLLKVSKKDVEDFDKKFKYTDHYLLKGRKWTLIDGTYYEIPRAPRITWFRNLHASCQAGTCVLAAGIVATAVTLPIVLNNNARYIVNENQWKNAFDNILNPTKERNVTANYDLVLKENTKTEVEFLGRTIITEGQFDLTEDAVLKIVNTNEYENSNESKIEKGYGEEIREEHHYDWYQKKVDNQILSKKIQDRQEAEWVVDSEYISSTVGLNELGTLFKDFIFKDNHYEGKLKFTEEYEEFEIEVEEDAIVEFENNKLKMVTFNIDFEKEVEYEIESMTMKMTIKMEGETKIALIDYGATSFEMPE